MRPLLTPACVIAVQETLHLYETCATHSKTVVISDCSRMVCFLLVAGTWYTRNQNFSDLYRNKINFVRGGWGEKSYFLRLTRVFGLIQNKSKC